MSNQVSGQGRGHPRLVILQSRTICAEATEAAVRKYTRWQVACVTTSMRAATAAAVARGAAALLFDTRNGSVLSVVARVRMLRSACPRVPLILLTEHEGRDFLETAVAARLSAIVCRGDSVEVFRRALEAVESTRRCAPQGIDKRALPMEHTAEFGSAPC